MREKKREMILNDYYSKTALLHALIKTDNVYLSNYSPEVKVYTLCCSVREKKTFLQWIIDNIKMQLYFRLYCNISTSYFLDILT